MSLLNLRLSARPSDKGVYGGNAITTCRPIRVVHVINDSVSAQAVVSLSALISDLAGAGDCQHVALVGRATAGSDNLARLPAILSTLAVEMGRIDCVAPRSVDSLVAGFDSPDVLHLHGYSDIFHALARGWSRLGLPLVATLDATEVLRELAGSGSRLFHFSQSARKYGFIVLVGPEYERKKLIALLDRRLGIAEKGEIGCDVRGAYHLVIGKCIRSILGFRVRVTDVASLTAFLDKSVSERTCRKLAFLNANLAVTASRDKRTALALRDFVLMNDGIGVNIASRLLYGTGFRTNLNGTDFIPRYLDCSTHRLRLFLLGAHPEIAIRTSAVMERRWPQHHIVGFHDGYFSDLDEDKIAAQISAAKPDIVLVAMGNPRQELWAARHTPASAPISICVGALFDFLSGEVRRAPLWVRLMRSEWLFRLSLEPRRLWRRYTIESLQFLLLVFAQYCSGARA